LAVAELGCIGDDLQVKNCHIGGCHGWGTGEDEDAEAEKVAKNHRSAELRDTEAASGLDGRHN
jgi:hypothetical protein